MISTKKSIYRKLFEIPIEIYFIFVFLAKNPAGSWYSTFPANESSWAQIPVDLKGFSLITANFIQ